MAIASKFHLWSPLATPAPTVTSITTPAPASVTSAPPVISITTPAPASVTPAPPVISITTPAPASVTPAQPVISITTPAPASVTPALAVSVATPPQAVAALQKTIAPAGTTTTTLPVTPSITPNIPLNPALLARIVRFAGTPTNLTIRASRTGLRWMLGETFGVTGSVVVVVPAGDKGGGRVPLLPAAV